MSSTKRLLFSATGLLLSAGPGVAATQGSSVTLVNTQHARRSDDANKGDDRKCADDGTDGAGEVDDERAPGSATTTTLVTTTTTVKAKGVVSGSDGKPCVPTTRPRTTTGRM